MVCLGDTTDAKDYHSAELINKIVDGLVLVQRGCLDVVVLMGNHDYQRAGHPYLAFLNHLPGVHYITKPTDDISLLLEGPPALYLPHTKNPVADWKGMDFSQYSYVFMHQTAPGSVASNGQKMDGEELPSLKGPKVYSGDIHVPQVLGDIEYVGSPYHVHFGDRYKPRAILLDRYGKAHDLHMPSLSRVTLTVEGLRQLKKERLQKGDQVKLRIKLDRGEVHEWHRIKRDAVEWLRTQEVEVHDVELVTQRATRRLIHAEGHAPALRPKTDADVVLAYVAAEELGADALDIGLDIVQ